MRSVLFFLIIASVVGLVTVQVSAQDDEQPTTAADGESIPAAATDEAQEDEQPSSAAAGGESIPAAVTQAVAGGDADGAVAAAEATTESQSAQESSLEEPTTAAAAPAGEDDSSASSDDSSEEKTTAVAAPDGEEERTSDAAPVGLDLETHGDDSQTHAPADGAVVSEGPVVVPSVEETQAPTQEQVTEEAALVPTVGDVAGGEVEAETKAPVESTVKETETEVLTTAAATGGELEDGAGEERTSEAEQVAVTTASILEVPVDQESDKSTVEQKAEEVEGTTAGAGAGAGAGAVIPIDEQENVQTTSSQEETEKVTEAAVVVEQEATTAAAAADAATTAVLVTTAATKQEKTTVASLISQYDKEKHGAAAVTIKIPGGKKLTPEQLRKLKRAIAKALNRRRAATTTATTTTTTTEAEIITSAEALVETTIVEIIQTTVASTVDVPATAVEVGTMSSELETTAAEAEAASTADAKAVLVTEQQIIIIETTASVADAEVETTTANGVVEQPSTAEVEIQPADEQETTTQTCGESQLAEDEVSAGHEVTTAGAVETDTVETVAMETTAVPVDSVAVPQEMDAPTAVADATTEAESVELQTSAAEPVEGLTTAGTETEQVTPAVVHDIDEEMRRRRREAVTDDATAEDGEYTEDDIEFVGDPSDPEAEFAIVVTGKDGLIPRDELAAILRDNKDKIEEETGVPFTVFSGPPVLKTSEVIDSTSAMPRRRTIWEAHQGLFITIIVLLAICILITIICCICVRCRTREDGEKKLVDMEEGNAKSPQPVSVSSPIPDDEIVCDEAPMLERENPALTHNGGGQHINKYDDDNGWVVPLEELNGIEPGLPEVENTRL